MARARAKKRPEPEPEVEATERDFVMARLLAARSALKDAMDTIDEAAGLFVNPMEDPKGKAREEAIINALEAVGVATRSLEEAEAAFPAVDVGEGEPWEDEDDEEDDEDDDDDE